MHRTSTPFSPQSKEIEFEGFSPTEYEIEKLNFKSNDIVWLGDMHGNIMLTLKLLRTIGLIEITKSDHKEYVQISENLELLQPFSKDVQLILTFEKRAKENFDDIEVSDYENILGAVESIGEMVECVGGNNRGEYTDQDFKALNKLTKSLEGCNDTDRLSQFVKQKNLENVVEELLRLCHKSALKLKNVISNDYIDFKNLLGRIKKGPSENNGVKLGFLGDRAADRRGCDLHTLRLQEALVELGLNIVAETFSNHVLELDYNLKFNPTLKKRLDNLTSENENISFFAEPLTDRDYVSLSPGKFSASMLNLFRCIVWDLESYDEVLNLYTNYYEPHLVLALAVRDKNKNESSSLVTHAPPALANHPDEIFSELLEFFEAPPCKDYNNAYEREQAANAINKGFHKWRKEVSPEKYKELFGKLNHPLHKVLWNRISSGDFGQIFAAYFSNEVKRNGYLFGHDSGIRELDSELRSWLYCGDGNAGKEALSDMGTAYICLTSFAATPGKTPYKKEAKAKIAGGNALASVVDTINIKSEKRKRRMADIHPQMRSHEDETESLADSMSRSPYRAPKPSFFDDNKKEANKEVTQEEKLKIMSSAL